MRRGRRRRRLPYAVRVTVTTPVLGIDAFSLESHNYGSRIKCVQCRECVVMPVTVFAAARISALSLTSRSTLARSLGANVYTRRSTISGGRLHAPPSRDDRLSLRPMVRAQCREQPSLSVEHVSRYTGRGASAGPASPKKGGLRLSSADEGRRDERLILVVEDVVVVAKAKHLVARKEFLLPLLEHCALTVIQLHVKHLHVGKLRGCARGERRR